MLELRTYFGEIVAYKIAVRNKDTGCYTAGKPIDGEIFHFDLGKEYGDSYEHIMYCWGWGGTECDYFYAYDTFDVCKYRWENSAVYHLADVAYQAEHHWVILEVKMFGKINDSDDSWLGPNYGHVVTASHQLAIREVHDFGSLATHKLSDKEIESLFGQDLDREHSGKLVDFIWP